MPSALSSSLLRRTPPWLRGWLLLAMVFGSTAAAEVTKEYQVKAAFLYNFTKFVEWPETALGVGEAPIVIGVLGRNPFGDELEKVARDHKVNGRSIVVIRLTAIDPANPPHALFVSGGEEKAFERELDAAAHARILTVGESERFENLGGMITFTTVDDKVRFEINARNAERAGLKVSAQLLKLAAAIRR